MIIVKAFRKPDSVHGYMAVMECESFVEFEMGSRVELKMPGTSVRTELHCDEKRDLGFLDIYFENEKGRTIHHISYDNIRPTE